MKIENITFTTNSTLQNKKQQNYKQNIHNYTNNYNPIAYKDFNISFGARLFRTPENFYAQSFNQNGMPQTMKDYLYDDFEDRRKMPPAQMLRLVFDDIKETKSLEQAKRLYKDEPLFKNLTDIPNRKSRSGVLAEIDLMKQEGKTLFKNGQDNLGLYILRKIYTESKTLKEINKDFQKDISVHYKGLSDLDYSTLAAFGIKFPNNSFWKSLTATREEFPYEYKPRKPIAEKHIIGTNRNSTTQQIEKPRQKGKFDDVKDWEIDKLTDAMVKGNGSKTQTEKLLKKHASHNKESLNFVAKYMGEINSLVLEKLHISEDMKDYFENYDDLTKNQKEKFESYMKIPQINEHRSKVMSATIRFFFDVYGVDGNNEEFQELLEYTHNIKAKRIENQQKHNLLQEEYERELGIFEETMPIISQSVKDVETTENLKDIHECLDEVKEMYDVETFEFNTEDGKVVIVSNLKEILNDYWKEKTAYLPTAFANKFLQYVNDEQADNSPYILSSVLMNKDINLPDDERLLSADKVEDTEIDMYRDFFSKNVIDTLAAQQAVADTFVSLTQGDVQTKLFALDVFEFEELYKNLSNEGKAIVRNSIGTINKGYMRYKQPLTDSEARKATLAITELLRKYDPRNSILKNSGISDSIKPSIVALKLTLENKNSKLIESLKNSLYEYLHKHYGGSSRFLIEKNLPEKLRMAKMEQILTRFIYDNANIVLYCMVSDKKILDYIKQNDPEMHHYLITQYWNEQMILGNVQFKI